ncbi:hypothetical protein TNCV_1618951 [Trichonephila clavipes]|nr:hypothetical protein TNCV_1618951 [Trichonephila clavipes]
MRPDLSTIRKISNRLKMWIGRRIQLKQLHPELYLNKPATTKGRGGGKNSLMHQREPTSRAPPSPQSSTLGPRRPRGGECPRKKNSPTESTGMNGLHAVSLHRSSTPKIKS